MRGTIVLAALLVPCLAQAEMPLQSFNVTGAANTCGLAISGKGLVSGLSSGGTLSASKPFLYDIARQHFRFPTPGTPPGILLFQGATLNRTILVTDILSGVVGTSSYVYRAGTTTALTGLAASASAINDTGTLLGMQSVFPTGFLGFILFPSGSVTTLNDGSGYVMPTAIDIANKNVVGLSGYGGFYYDGTEYHVISVPSATVLTWPRGVDTTGRVAGTYYTGTQSAPVANGFLWKAGVYNTWNVSGAFNTEINGANEAGQIVGCYTDGLGVHGFVAKP